MRLEPSRERQGTSKTCRKSVVGLTQKDRKPITFTQMSDSESPFTLPRTEKPNPTGGLEPRIFLLQKEKKSYWQRLQGFSWMHNVINKQSLNNEQV